MEYPIVRSADLEPKQTLTVPFRPQAAGQVKAIVVATWHPAASAGGGGAVAEPEPAVFTMRVQLDITRPGSNTPAASETAQKKVGTDPTKDFGRPRLVLWADAAATAADVTANWTATVTNTGEVPISCAVTLRYQTVESDLGKIDHIVVLMLENRSFDHMLGYLTLENRPDVEGLKGTESNSDSNNIGHAVHHRLDPVFPTDPGHGWPDVTIQLTSPSGQINGGFIRDFAKVLDDNAKALPPLFTSVVDQGQVAGGDPRVIRFRPAQPGRISILSKINPPIGRSETGRLAQLTLRTPDNRKVADQTVRVSESHDTISVSYEATSADLAAAGEWTCTVVNWTETDADFQTTVTYVLKAHDTSGQQAPEEIMGYYTGQELPAYDLLAREFAVCDHWFASLPTDTWPNRLYALTGGSSDITGFPPTTPSSDDVSRNPPSYLRQTIFEVLQKRGIDWKVWFSDIPFVLLFKTFAQNAQYSKRVRSVAELQEAAETGDLPSVVWIDPNFSDFRESSAAASDDHPPGGITNGQAFVRQIYESLSSSPAWTKTLFLITYDEHGGFYDHVPPPGLSANAQSPAPGGPDDDDPRLKRYGVRVPALVISPWVRAGSVSKELYDHTSILSTILHRFCPNDAGAMGKRTAGAKHVGPLLSLPAPRAERPSMRNIPVRTGPGPRKRDVDGEVLRRAVFGL